jgi:RNA polymerase sigma-B factor
VTSTDTWTAHAHAGDAAEPGGRPEDGHRHTDRLLRRLAALPPTHPERHGLRRQAIEASVPAAASLARRYAHRGEPLADLQQVAFVGLVKAVDGFETAYETDFWAYAVPTITGEIKRYFRDSTWSVHVPRRYKDLGHAVNRCRDELFQRLRRAPRVADFAAHLDEDQAEITRALAAEVVRSPVPLSTPGRLPGTSLVDRCGEDEAGFNLVDLRESIHPALAELPDREQLIIAMRFFGNMTQAQIAAEVGLSQMHVSRLITKSLRRLHRSLCDSP